MVPPMADMVLFSSEFDPNVRLGSKMLSRCSLFFIL